MTENNLGLMQNVQWEECSGNHDPSSSLPYATHRGVLHIGRGELICFRLNTGEAVFEAESFKKFMDEWFGGPIIDVAPAPESHKESNE